jgi:hypothetical protein
MVISKIVVSREIPGFKGFGANDDGSITKPNCKKTFGSLNKTTGYFRIKIYYKSYPVHRLIAFAWVDNPRPDIFIVVDHIDGNTRNNVPGNLRWLTKRLNHLNSKGKNCYFQKLCKRWQAYYMFYGKTLTLGYFDTEAEAHRVGRAGRDACFEKEYARLCAGGNP